MSKQAENNCDHVYRYIDTYSFVEQGARQSYFLFYCEKCLFLKYKPNGKPRPDYTSGHMSAAQIMQAYAD